MCDQVLSVLMLVLMWGEYVVALVYKQIGFFDNPRLIFGC